MISAYVLLLLAVSLVKSGSPPAFWSIPGPVLVYQRPIEAMVDVTNDLGVAVLQDYAYTRSNFAFSPYGVASVLVVLYEGARGEAARQIHNTLRLPWNRDITRIGFRDIHRHLRSYFSHEGYLSGLTLNKNYTSLLPEYRRVLRFYGYDVGLATGDTFPPTTTKKPTTTTPNLTTTTIQNEVTTEETEVTSTTALSQEGGEEGSPPITEDIIPSITEDIIPPITEDIIPPITEDIIPPATEDIIPPTTERTVTSLEEGVTLITLNIPREPESESPSDEPVNDDVITRDSTNVPNIETSHTTLEISSTSPSSMPDTDRTTLSSITSTALLGDAPQEPVSTLSSEVTEATAPTVRVMALTEQLETETMAPREMIGTELASLTLLTEVAAPSDRTTINMDESTEQSLATSPTEPSTDAITTVEIEQQSVGSTSTVQSATVTTSIATNPQITETSTLSEQQTEVASDNNISQGQTTNTELPSERMMPEGSSHFEITTSILTTHAATETTVLETTTNNNNIVQESESVDTFTDNQVLTESISEGNELPVTPLPLVYNRTRRSIEDAMVVFPDISLQLQNGMFDSQVARGYELYTQLPKRPFLVDGVSEELVPVMSYTAMFPFAYIRRLHAQALEFPLDDERYKLLLLLPVERRGLRQLIYDLSSCPLREIYQALRPTRVQAVIPSFMVEGFVILTPTLQQLGIWDVFDPRRADLSGMSNDPELYVRNIEQAVTVVIRNYVKILDIQTRTMAARATIERFVVTHPFLYFVLDTDTHVALMAGKIVDPLNSRIY